jgi:hypothetical protein
MLAGKARDVKHPTAPVHLPALPTATVILLKRFLAASVLLAGWAMIAALHAPMAPRFLPTAIRLFVIATLGFLASRAIKSARRMADLSMERVIVPLSLAGEALSVKFQDVLACLEKIAAAVVRAPNPPTARLESANAILGGAALAAMYPNAQVL